MTLRFSASSNLARTRRSATHHAPEARRCNRPALQCWESQEETRAPEHPPRKRASVPASPHGPPTTRHPPAQRAGGATQQQPSTSVLGKPRQNRPEPRSRCLGSPTATVSPKLPLFQSYKGRRLLTDRRPPDTRHGPTRRRHNAATAQHFSAGKAAKKPEPRRGGAFPHRTHFASLAPCVQPLAKSDLSLPPISTPYPLSPIPCISCQPPHLFTKVTRIDSK